MLLKLYYFMIFILANQALGAGKSSSGLDIMEDHLNRNTTAAAFQARVQELANTKIDLKSEIVKADTKYLQRMLNFNSCMSYFWKITNHVSEVGNYTALAGTVLAAALDFYYREYDPEKDTGNSLYNNMSFSLALAAFGTNLLQLFAYRMYNKCEGTKVHLRKSLNSDNPLASFRKLEGEDLELSATRIKKAKEAKKTKKSKSPKCMAIAPIDNNSVGLQKSHANQSDYARIHRIIQKHAYMASFWRTVNSMAEFLNVFTTIGNSVVTGMDFFYRENDLAGSSTNSNYNKSSISLSVLSIATKIFQSVSLRRLTKSERIHINMLKALSAENVIEAFKKLEKGIDQDGEESLQLKNNTDDQVKTEEKQQVIAQPTITHPFMIPEESSHQKNNELSEIFIFKTPTSKSRSTENRSAITTMESYTADTVLCSKQQTDITSSSRSEISRSETKSNF